MKRQRKIVLSVCVIGALSLCSCSTADFGTRLDKFGDELGKAVHNLITTEQPASEQPAPEQAAPALAQSEGDTQTVAAEALDVNSLFDKVVNKEPAGQAGAVKKQHDIVIEAQQLLNQKGYNVGIPDGKMGPKTKQAIMSFQKSHNFAATGTLTQETIDKLREPAQAAKK